MNIFHNLENHVNGLQFKFVLVSKIRIVNYSQVHVQHFELNNWTPRKICVILQCCVRMRRADRHLYARIIFLKSIFKEIK